MAAAFGKWFRFEESVVRLRRSGLFEPLRDGVQRWTAYGEASYRILGMNFQILYQLRDDRFVRIDYLHCHAAGVPEYMTHRIPVDRADWFSPDPPTGEYVDVHTALDFLLAHQFSVPVGLREQLADLQEPETPQREVRPLEYWMQFDEFTSWPIRRMTSDVDLFDVARRVESCCIELVQGLRAGNDPDGTTVMGLAASLAGKYRVDATTWPVDSDRTPPDSLRFLELEWPRSLAAVRAVLTRLHQQIAPLLAASVADMGSIDDPRGPWTAEQSMIAEAWQEVLPELDATTAEIRRVLSRVRPSDSTRSVASKVAAEPGEDIAKRYAVALSAFEFASGRLHAAGTQNVTDQDAYDWLIEHGYEGLELPVFDTWTRYLREARRLTASSKNSPRGGRTGRNVRKQDEL